MRSEIRPRVAIYTVVSLVCSFLDLLKLGRSGELGEPDNAKKRSEKIRTENTTNRHENVTETQRGETVANGHSSCCLCIALGEQHAPCCGDARVDAAMRAYHTPPACQRVAPVHKSESSTAGSRRHITFHHGLATHSPLMHAYVTEPGLTTKADFSESGTPNLTPFLSAHPRSLSVYISPTRQLGLYPLTMHF